MDRTNLLQRFEGDEGLLDELIATFLEDRPVLSSEIQNAIAAGDFARLRRAAHSLKGSARVFDAQACAAAAAALEAAAASEITDGLGPLWSRLQFEVQRVSEGLEAAAGPNR